MEYEYRAYRVRAGYIAEQSYGKPILTEIFNNPELKGWELFNITTAHIQDVSDIIIYHFRKPINNKPVNYDYTRTI